MYFISNLERNLIKFLKPTGFNIVPIGAFSTKPLTERDIENVLKKRFPTAEKIHVVDESGGCGAQFSVTVHSNDFRGFPLVKQHRMVMESLQKEIGSMHAIRVFTSAPKSKN